MLEILRHLVVLLLGGAILASPLTALPLPGVDDQAPCACCVEQPAPTPPPACPHCAGHLTGKSAAASPTQKKGCCSEGPCNSCGGCECCVHSLPLVLAEPREGPRVPVSALDASVPSFVSRLSERFDELNPPVPRDLTFARR